MMLEFWLSLLPLAILHSPLFVVAEQVIADVDGDPYIEGSRTGIWTSLTCTDPAVEGVAKITSQERWKMLDCDNAWSDAVNIWTTIDHAAKNLTFSQSIANTFHVNEIAYCDNLGADSNCDSTIECSDAVGKGSGPAGYEVYNSLIVIHQIYKNYEAALMQIAGIIAFGVQSFQNDFAPVPTPQNDATLDLLFDLIGLGALMASAPFFNSYLRSMPYFEENPRLLSTIKDSTYAIIATTTEILKDLSGSGNNTLGSWSPEEQAELSAYLGQVIWAWSNMTENAIENLFDGNASSIKILESLISDGKLIEGSLNGHANSNDSYPPPPPDNAELQASILTTYYAYAIPASWSFSNIHPFVMDTGKACGEDLDSNLIATCYAGRNFYLAYPDGDAQSCIPGGADSDEHCTQRDFSVPPGLAKLDGNAYGGITADILVQGSLNTFWKNGNNNGAPSASLTDSATIDDLYNQNITTPGIIRIPVCTAEDAIANWNAPQGVNLTYYPCSTISISPVVSRLPNVIH